MRIPLMLAIAVAWTARGADKPRVFVTESQPLHIAGDAAVGDAKGSLLVAGGTTRENVEVMKNFSQYCPGVVVTSNRDKAEYVVRLDHEGANPTTLFVHGNKVAVFNKAEDLIYSGSTRLLSRAVKDACEAIVGRAQK